MRLNMGHFMGRFSISIGGTEFKVRRGSPFSSTSSLNREVVRCLTTNVRYGVLGVTRQ
jgi:hypothetical protein